MATNKRQQQIRTTLVQFYNQPIAKVSLELFLSIGAVIFFALFAIRPTLITMSELVKEIEDKEALDQQLSQKVAALATVQNEYLVVENRLEVLDEAIPNQPELETTLKIIEKVASDNDLVITSVQVQELPQPTDETIPFEDKERVSLPINVIVAGEYTAIRNFIDDLNNSRRALIVDSIVFSVSQERESRKLRATITVNMQYYGVTN
jgi:Tfp pilus assembly protein PilO